MQRNYRKTSIPGCTCRGVKLRGARNRTKASTRLSPPPKLLGLLYFVGYGPIECRRALSCLDFNGQRHGGVKTKRAASRKKAAELEAPRLKGHFATPQF